MAKRSYPAVLELAESGGYGIVFPDLPGCVSFADTADEAPAQAAEALSLHLEGMAEDGERFPDAAPLEETWKAYSPAMMMLVTVEAPDQAERVNIYLQRSLLERIEAHLAEVGGNRSAFFVNAARNYLEVFKRASETGVTRTVLKETPESRVFREVLRLAEVAEESKRSKWDHIIARMVDLVDEPFFVGDLTAEATIIRSGAISEAVGVAVGGSDGGKADVSSTPPGQRKLRV